MPKRITGLFCCMVFMITICIYRICYVDMADYLSMAASVQGVYTLNIATARGGIYDRNMKPLVNTQQRFVAAVLPTPQATAELLRVQPEEEREALLGRLSGGLPFSMEVPTNNIYAVGVDIFRVPKRYGETQLAPHIVGYLGDGGRSGVSGIERAFDTNLAEYGAKLYAKYKLDAAGRAMHGGGVEIGRENESSAGGVVLTLDMDIQEIAQKAIYEGCEKGAVVVLDVDTGDILAMASVPVFDQNDISKSLGSTDAPFINRAVSGYNIGSVFKLAVAAAALETGFSSGRSYECKGSIDIDGQIFRCNNHSVHGLIDMQKALEVSCNTYFISLALQIEPQYMLSLCRHFGIGSAAELAPGFLTQTGNLPSAQELSNPVALANFGFGQGSSLATPLQIAQMVSCVANNGTSVTPRLVRGLTDDGMNISVPASNYAGGEILSPDTAGTLQKLMIGVIEEGSGKPGRPVKGGAGGKTSSAQTGLFDDEDEEIVHAWFAGFYPAENPRYSIVVFVENGKSGERAAAPVFKQIADGIGSL